MHGPLYVKFLDLVSYNAVYNNAIITRGLQGCTNIY